MNDTVVLSDRATLAGNGCSSDLPKAEELRVLDTCLPGHVPYYFGRGILHSLHKKLAEYEFDRLYLVTSAPVWRLYGSALCETLRGSWSCDPVLIQDGEANKTFGALAQLCEQL